MHNNQVCEIDIKNINNKDENRLYVLDVIRSFAIFSVVFCHVVQYMFAVADITKSLPYQILSFSLFTFGRLGVPLFLFLTGFLCLSKNIKDDEGVWKFYSHNLFPIILKYIFWTTIGQIFLCVVCKEPFVIKNFIKYLFFIDEPELMCHMWYMPMIVGLYLAIPFVSYIVNHFSFKSMILVIIICFIQAFIIPSKLDLRLFGCAYGLYILAGYYIKQGYFNKIPKYFYLFGFLLFFCLTVLYQILFSMYKWPYQVWYDNLFLFICSFCLFVFMARLKVKNRIIIKVSNFISKISFTIYFVHIFSVIYFSQLLSRTNLAVAPKFFILLLITYTVSIIVSTIIYFIKLSVRKSKEKV